LHYHIIVSSFSGPLDKVRWLASQWIQSRDIYNMYVTTIYTISQGEPNCGSRAAFGS